MHLCMAPATWTDTDADLHETLGQGASEAIAAVYDRYSGLAYGLALGIVGDPARATSDEAPSTGAFGSRYSGATARDVREPPPIGGFVR